MVEKRSCMLPLPSMLHVICLPQQGQIRDKLNKAFFPCWCATVSSFPAGVQQGLLFSLLVRHKFPTLKCCHSFQTKWPLVIKHINWVDNYQMIVTAKYDSHYITCYGENAINHFLTISLWDLSVAIATKQKKSRSLILAMFKSPLPKQQSYLIRNKSLLRLWKSCFNVLTDGRSDGQTDGRPTATGHITHKLGKQSSNDHNCQIWFTSLHVLWRKCNLNIFQW